MDERLLAFRDKLNFRDLGAYQGADGRRVLAGRIFRSAGLYAMNAEESLAFDKLGIRYVFDLRTSSEVAARPNPAFENVEFIQHSGLVFRGGEEIDFSPAGMHQIGEGGQAQLAKLKSYYAGMAFDNEAFRILMSMLENHQVPLVFHCATGKDRTGVAAIIILLALGVSKQDALHDYLLSNEYRKDIIAKKLQKHAQLIDADPVALQLIRMESGVTEEIGQLVLDTFDERYDSLDAYFEEEFGLDHERLERLRDYYLE